jgi:predicted phage tail protein
MNSTITYRIVQIICSISGIVITIAIWTNTILPAHMGIALVIMLIFYISSLLFAGIAQILETLQEKK